MEILIGPFPPRTPHVLSVQTPSGVVSFNT